MNLAIVGVLAGGLALASTAGWALYERGQAIKYEAQVLQWKAADEQNKKTISDMRINAARDTIRVTELDYQLRSLQDRQRARTERIANAKDSNTCGDAMRALFDSLWDDPGTDDSDLRRPGTPR